MIASGEFVDNFMFAFATVNFSHMAILMFIFSVLLCITVSILTNPPDYSKISGLSYGTLTVNHRKENGESYDTVDVILSIILVIIVVSILSYFTA